MPFHSRPLRIYDIRFTACSVSKLAQHVRIDPQAIGLWADRVEDAAIVPAPMPAELIFVGPPADAARWTLLVDCLNFCFWTPSGQPWTVEFQGRPWQRYLALVASLRRAVATDARWLTPERWADATAAQLETVFAGAGRIPMFEDRVRILNETGQILGSRFRDEALNLAAEADYQADRIAALVCNTFPSFRDIHIYRSLDVAILKRAQIFASDLADTLTRNQGPAIAGREKLTAFADYRVPQYLRHLKILLLKPALEERIDRGDAIIASSPEEIELRACSIHAVELMVQALRERRQIDKPAWLVDEYLWYHSHDADVTNQHHRTVTWYY